LHTSLFTFVVVIVPIFIRLIEQYERKTAPSSHSGAKKLLKPRVTKDNKTTTVKRRESWQEDSDDDENDEKDELNLRRGERKTTQSQKKDKTKPSFLLQTSSGRTPKATARYVAEGGGAATNEGPQPHATANKRPASETATPKRVKLANKASDVSTKICMTIKKVGSGESDSSFESTILGLEEELKRLPGAARGTPNRKKRVKAEEEGEEEGEMEEEMPPKLEPNYPDLKVHCSLH
jgi:hypothetical protein